MKRQRNTTQMKEQTRNTEVQMNEEEIGKLSEKEFIIMIVKMIKNLESKMEKMQESINKDPMNRSTPGFPVYHQLPEFTQTHVHRVSDAIQPSHPLPSPSPVPEVSGTLLSSFHSFYFILLFRSYFHHFIFQLTELFFCFRYAATDSF